LESDQIQLDYSFVTGEATPVKKKKGAQLFAGGKIEKQSGVARVLKPVSESKLTQLWKQPAFQKKEKEALPSFADQISRFFTPTLLIIATGVGALWFWIDASRVVEIFTALLIVACPCAIALSSPFIWGHLMRYFDRLNCFPRNTETLEKLAHINHIVVDKTGTLTDPKLYRVTYEGLPLTPKELSSIKSIVYQSDHPLSKALFNHLDGVDFDTNTNCIQHLGKGLEAIVGKQKIKLGSGPFVGILTSKKEIHSAVHIALNEHYKGCFLMQPAYRPGLKTFFKQLQPYPLSLLSGDTASGTQQIAKILPLKSIFHFGQSPFQKVDFIKQQQQKGYRILMIGDGLNDAGALQQSDVGLAVNNQTHAFTPACDLIMYGENLFQLPHFLAAVHQGKRLIYWSFGLSLIYNLVGLSVAAFGYLSPIVAAILMPLSSISVIFFASLSTYMVFKKLKNKLDN
jgi:Cu+-exporting ATPase